MRMIISEVAPPDWQDCNKSKLNRESGHKWYHCITLCPIKYVNVPARGLSLLPDTVPGLPLVENQQKSVVSCRAEIWDQSARGLNRNITNQPGLGLKQRKSGIPGNETIFLFLSAGAVRHLGMVWLAGADANELPKLLLSVFTRLQI